jgi:hypothetical protein
LPPPARAARRRAASTIACRVAAVGHARAPARRGTRWTRHALSRRRLPAPLHPIQRTRGPRYHRRRAGFARPHPQASAREERGGRRGTRRRRDLGFPWSPRGGDAQGLPSVINILADGPSGIRIHRRRFLVVSASCAQSLDRTLPEHLIQQSLPFSFI